MSSSVEDLDDRSNRSAPTTAASDDGSVGALGPKAAMWYVSALCVKWYVSYVCGELTT
jgi:hypothetical protein